MSGAPGLAVYDDDSYNQYGHEHAKELIISAYICTIINQLSFLIKLKHLEIFTH